MSWGAAEIIRTANITLVLVHMPLIYLRIKEGRHQAYVTQTLSLAIIYLGIAQGSFATLSQEVRPGTIMVCVGLASSLVIMWRRHLNEREWRDNRTSRNDE